MLASLSIEGHTPCPSLPWIEESWSDGGAFFHALSTEHATSLPARSKSVVLERYDLHFDLVHRNILGDREAFRWQDRHDAWQTLSYAELDERSARRAGEWTAHGVEAGQTLCIILPFGPDWVVAFLAAVRLGCVVSFLPPAGPRFYAKRLDALAPDFIATADLYGPSLGEFRAQAIPEHLPPGERRADTFVHASGDPFALLFSPLAQDCHLPISLSVDAAYCFALRDGLLVHGLRPGDVFAAPGADLLQYQPALLLATFLAGGVYVHVEAEALARDPAAFTALDFSTVGVMPRTRDLLLEAGVRLGKRWGHWWRGVNEESDYQPWHRFVSEAGLRAVPASNVLIDSSAGGATFFSARRRHKHGGMSSFVLPAAGVPWMLTHVGAGAAGVDLGQSQGLYAPGDLQVGKPLPGSHILHRQHAEWYYAGVTRPTREGREYPVDEVLGCLDGLPFLEGATVLPVTTADPARPFAFALLGFVGRARTEELAGELDTWRRGIETAILNGLGPGFAPDRIELFPFSPRWNEDQVDMDWCRDRYTRGGLHARITREVFVVLDDLRELVAAAGEGAAS